jgi:GNAT superfamily N-acetyltransferase
VWGANFGWMRQRMGDHMAIPGYLSIFVAYVDQRPACAGWTYFHPNSQFAGLWGGSTLPEYRKRGLYTAVLAARVQEAIQRGYRYLTIEAGPMSRPIVATHGFQLLTMTASYGWKGGG